MAALCLAVAAAWAETAGETAADPPTAGYAVPSFRHLDPRQPVPDLGAVSAVRFIADDGFPPFSYRDDRGQLTGLMPALASALCRELRLTCEFTVRRYEEAVEALERGEGDAVLTGVAVTPAARLSLDFTRPFLRPLGRFAVAAASPLDDTGVRPLAGRRLGAVDGTAHKAFLDRFYPRSRVTGFASREALYEALQAGTVDAAFDDAFRLMFWVDGAASQACCRLVGEGYLAPDYFSHGIAIGVARGNRPLREVLDYGLDRLHETGSFARIYRRFFPASPL